MGYYIDLENLSIEKYKEILKTADLLPSRLILKEEIDANFDLLERQRIKNIDELFVLLKNKNKLLKFSEISGISKDYLTILIREIKSYRQTPNRVQDFPGIKDDTILKLAKLGLKNTFQLFDKVITKKDRLKISELAEIPELEILKITKLTDLSRIRWVNHTFAYVLFEAKYETAGQVANADYKEMYEAVKQLNTEKGLYKGHIGLHDMKRCVEAAKDLSFEIEY